METLLAAGWSEMGTLDLPVAIRKQHFSRGELDGHLVGISAGLKEPDSDPFLSLLTRQLLCNGATLAYAGAFEPKGTLSQVHAAACEAPPDLVAETNPHTGERIYRARVRNYLGHPACLIPAYSSNPVLTGFPAVSEVSELPRCWQWLLRRPESVPSSAEGGI